MQKAPYERMADAIRREIDEGVHAPGAKLDSAKELGLKHGIKSQETALKALRLLEHQGYITLEHRKVARVRQRPVSRAVVRDRHAYRDELGYFFDQNAKDWRAIGKPTRGLSVPPPHVAHLLGIPEGQDALVRDRGMGPAGSEHPLQIATSYIPLSLVADIPAVGAERTGPGGIYDRIEEHFKAPIEWREEISSRLPDTDERERLNLPQTMPVLVVTRESRVFVGGRMVTVEVNETRMSSELFSVAYTVIRDRSAVWPREERI